MKINKIFLPLAIILALTIFLAVFNNRKPAIFKQINNPTTWWKVKSVDTMKYSRDLARQGLNDPTLPGIIETQVAEIAATGATYVSIATPYDEEFLPFLKMWVTAARKHRLNVWFRGNWSGWEGWFGYPGISRDEHLAKTTDFINKNADLFEDGDIFTPCPECENGGPGDPRNTGDISGFRQFMIDEYQATDRAIKQIHRRIIVNFDSMNADVAKVIMDKATTTALGGVVVIDHYVDTPEKLVADIKEIARNSGGRIVLGEFGVPIPDINGEMTEVQQSEWINSALAKLSSIPEVAGLNYWVGVGGTTQLWNDDGTARTAVTVIKKYYNPQKLALTVKNDAKQPLPGATIFYHNQTFVTDNQGKATVIISPGDNLLKISDKDYRNLDLMLMDNQTSVTVVLTKIHEGLLFKLQELINNKTM